MILGVTLLDPDGHLYSSAILEAATLYWSLLEGISGAKQSSVRGVIDALYGVTRDRGSLMAKLAYYCITTSDPTDS